MKVRYFVVDREGRLTTASQAAVKAVWDGKRDAAAFGDIAPDELRLVSVLCDDQLVPMKVFFFRLTLSAAYFTENARDSLRRMAVQQMPDPTRIVPVGPLIDLSAPPIGRSRLAG